MKASLPFLVSPCGAPGAVGHVSDPVFPVPGNNRFCRVEGFAVQIHGSAIVQNPAVYRPAPRPVWIQTYCRLHGSLRRIAPLGFIPFFFRITAGVQPVQGRSGTVRLKISEGRHELSTLVQLVADLCILPEESVDPAGPFLRVIAFRPVQLQQRFRQGSALISVQVAQSVDQRNKDIRKVSCFAARLDSLVEPQQPASAVADGSGLFDSVSGGQQKDFRLFRFRINAGTAPSCPSFPSYAARNHTIQSRLSRARRILLVFGKLFMGLTPKMKPPVI